MGYVNDISPILKDVSEKTCKLLEEYKLVARQSMLDLLFYHPNDLIISEIPDDDRKKIIRGLFLPEYFLDHLDAVIKVEYCCSAVTWGNSKTTYLLDVLEEEIYYKDERGNRVITDQKVKIDKVNYYPVVARISTENYKSKIENTANFDAPHTDLKIIRMSGKVEEYHGFDESETGKILHEIFVIATEYMPQ